MDAQLTRARQFTLTSIVLAALTGSLPLRADAQGASQSEPIRITAPPITVTAQKEPADSSKLPVSVTAVSGLIIGGIFY